MQTSKSNILIVDDEPDIRSTINEILLDEGYQVAVAHDADTARSAVRLQEFDAILLDIWMPGDDGVSLLKEWRDSGLDTPVVMMSGHGTVETAVEATRYGAYDYLEKPISLGRLLVAIRNAVSSQTSVFEQQQVKEPIRSRIVGSSDAIKNVMKQLKNLATLTGTIMIQGEAGSGKKFFARTIHEEAGKDPEKFIIVDLNTDIDIDEIAATMAALGTQGTVLIPDIHGFNSQAQLQLVSLLNRAERLRQSSQAKITARLIVTTTPGIVEAVNRAYFRSDLFYRLRDLVIVVPPLRDHPEDIPELVGYFTDQFSRVDQLPYKRISTSALNRLKNHTWMGNVMELRSVIRQVLVNSTEDVISASDLLLYLLDVGAPQFIPPETSAIEKQQFNVQIREAREQFERDYLIHNLRQCSNYKEMQERTGMDRTNLYRKMKKYDIDISPGGGEVVSE